MALALTSNGDALRTLAENRAHGRHCHRSCGLPCVRLLLPIRAASQGRGQDGCRGTFRRIRMQANSTLGKEHDGSGTFRLRRVSRRHRLLDQERGFACVAFWRRSGACGTGHQLRASSMDQLKSPDLREDWEGFRPRQLAVPSCRYQPLAMPNLLWQSLRVANTTRQPTPDARRRSIRSPLARRSCARWAAPQ